MLTDRYCIETWISPGVQVAELHAATTAEARDLREALVQRYPRGVTVVTDREDEERGDISGELEDENHAD